MSSGTKSYIKANTWLLLLLISAFFLSAYLLYYLSVKYINLLMIVIELAFIIITFAVVFFMVISLIAYRKGQINRFLILPLKIFNSFLYPLLNFIGKIVHVNREQLKLYFIEINNIIVASENKRYKAEELLLITPHCLQNSECKIKITNDASNCKQCGNCNIGDLLKLSEIYGVKFYVASGGTFARKIVQDIKPKAIISIACERDLLSGIQDINNIPVIGIVNIRNFGPCFNTSVDITKVEHTIQSVII